MRFLTILYLLFFTCVSAQTPFLKVYGPADLRTNEAGMSLLGDVAFLTAVYREEGGAAGEEQLVFAHFDRETGAPQENFRTAFPYNPNSLSSAATADGALVAAYILADGRVVVSKYQNNAVLLATDTLPLTASPSLRLSLKESSDGKIILATITTEEVKFSRYSSNLTSELSTVYDEGGAAFQDFIVLPNGNYLTFQPATDGNDFLASVIDADNGNLAAEHILEGSEGLLTFRTGRFVQHPENNEISLVLGRFVSQEIPLQPVIYSFNAEGTPDTSHDLASIGGRNQMILQGISPRGALVWLISGVGLFVHRDYQQSGDNLTPLTSLPQYNDQSINGIIRIVSDDEIYFLSSVLINNNDRDVIVTSIKLAGANWQQQLGRSGGLTNDQAINSTRDALGNLYLLSASPDADQQEIVATVLKVNPEGNTVWVKRLSGPTGQATTPNTLVFRSDGLLFVQHYTNEVTYQEVIGPEGDFRYAQTTEPLEDTRVQKEPYSPLPLGGGQVITFRVVNRFTVMDVFRADGSRRYSVTLFGLGNPRGLNRLEDNKILLMGRSLDGTDLVRIVKFDLDTRQEVWSRNLGTNSSTGAVDFAKKAILVPNGGYLVVTNTHAFSENSPPEGLNVYRITPNGEIGAPAFFAQPTPYFAQPIAAYLNANDDLVLVSTTSDESTGLLRSIRLRPDDFNVVETVDVTIPYQDFFPANITPTRDGYVVLYGHVFESSPRSAQLFALSAKVDNEPTGTANGLPFLGQISVFPNPSAGPQTLTVELPVAAALNLSFFDVSGRLLSSLRLPVAANHRLLLDAATYPAGAAILQVTDPSGSNRNLRLFRFR